MTTAFGRVCKATAYWPSTGFVGKNESFFEKLDNGLEITDLDMSFTIDKKLTREPNTCDLTIVNASPRTRARLEKNPLTVRLEAGHDNTPRFLFLGDLRFGRSKLDGVDWNTKLQLQDGGRAYAHARINRSYTAGTPTIVLIRDAAKSLGLVLPRAIETGVGHEELHAALKSGTVLEGKARDELTRLLAEYGYTWSIQSGKLQILRDEEIGETRAWSVDGDAGIIGTPSYGDPDKKGEPPVLSIKMLLFPELTPGGLIDVSTESVKGVHRIKELKHTGNTAALDWYTDVKATPTNHARFSVLKAGKGRK